MCAAFEERLPQQVVDLMRPGDGILVGSFNNWVSWLIMYLTSSQVSHVAIYLGGRQIIHQNIGGVSIDPLEDLFKPKVRLLPFAYPMPENTHDEIMARLRRKVGAPYAMQHVFRKAYLILLGRDWPFFRCRFFLDVLLLLALLDLPFFVWLGAPVLCLLAVPYLVIVGVNALVWCKWPPRATKKPVDFIPWTVLLGGSFATDWSSPLFHRYQRPWDA